MGGSASKDVLALSIESDQNRASVNCLVEVSGDPGEVVSNCDVIGCSSLFSVKGNEAESVVGGDFSRDQAVAPGCSAQEKNESVFLSSVDGTGRD